MPTGAAPSTAFANSGNSSCSRREDRPIRYCTNFDGAICAGADSCIWIWSGDTSPRMITTFPRLAALSDQIARPLRYPPAQYLVPLLCNPHYVILQIEDGVRTPPIFSHPLILVELRWKLIA